MGGAYEVKDGAAKKYYSIAGMMVAVNDGTGLQYLLTDHLGSVVAVTNASGTLTSQQRYLPFGGTRTIPNSPILGTDFGYTGQRMLDEGMGGIMDYKARFYSPYINRFQQPDSIIPNPANPQSFNRFSYVAGNPINFNDPSGHDADYFCSGSNDTSSRCTGFVQDQGTLGSSQNGGGNSGGQGDEGEEPNAENQLTAELGDFQLLPATYDFLTYSQIAQEGYSGYWLSGAPAYGDVLFPPFSVNSRQVGWGATAAFPSILLDWANMLAPSLQRAVSPYTQSVSIRYSVEYYNVPRIDAYKVTTVNELLITNSSRRRVNYTVALSSPSHPSITRSAVLSAAPNETIRVPMPAEFSFMGVLNAAVHAFTGCTGTCIGPNPPLPSLAGSGNFSFSP
jgi:RHS repeat-associated protein